LSSNSPKPSPSTPFNTAAKRKFLSLTHYSDLTDEVITGDIKDDAIKTKGYFIYPSQLFCNVVAKANNNENLNTDLATIFSAIESSANGYPSEVDIKGLFADFDTTSNRLGNTVKDKNLRLASVLKGVIHRAAHIVGNFPNLALQGGALLHTGHGVTQSAFLQCSGQSQQQRKLKYRFGHDIFRY
jgi:hypothetical protein